MKLRRKCLQSERRGTAQISRTTAKLLSSQDHLCHICLLVRSDPGVVNLMRRQLVCCVIGSSDIIHWMVCYKFLFSKTNRRTNFPNIFCEENLHVSGSSSVHHQEFSTVYSALVYVMQVWWQLSAEVGPGGPKHVGANVGYFNVNFNILYV